MSILQNLHRHDHKMTFQKCLFKHLTHTVWVKIQSKHLFHLQFVVKVQCVVSTTQLLPKEKVHIGWTLESSKVLPTSYLVESITKITECLQFEEKLQFRSFALCGFSSLLYDISILRSIKGPLCSSPFPEAFISWPFFMSAAPKEPVLWFPTLSPCMHIISITRSPFCMNIFHTDFLMQIPSWRSQFFRPPQLISSLEMPYFQRWRRFKIGIST